MIKEITIIGYPSKMGGANTEMLDQIKVWNHMGMKINIIPTKPFDKYQKDIDLSKYGCTVYPLRSFQNAKNKDCIAFCNHNALHLLPEITKYSRTFTNVPCMCVPVDNEKKYQDLIDLWIFQTEINKKKTLEPLKNKNQIQSIFVTPYFDSALFPFYPSNMRIRDRFSFGRLSRMDPLKFNKDQMWIYSNFRTLRPKLCNIVGWNDEFSQKCGKINASWIHYYPAGSVDVPSFYRTCNVFSITADTIENFPRTTFEAMCSGSVIVTDNKGGWKEQIKNKETGFLCNNREEFLKVMEFLAGNPQIENQIRLNALKYVKENFGMEQSSRSWEKIFNKIEKISKKKKIKK